MATVSAAGDRYLVNAKVVESATAKVLVVEKAELLDTRSTGSTGIQFK